MSGGFQTSVNVQPAVAVAGDFCDSNPRATVNAGPGGFVAGAAGVTVGRFAWTQALALDADAEPTVVNSFGFGAPTGFVHREQQGLITAYLAGSGMLVQGGFPVTLFSAGGFWAKNDGSTQALIGQKAYADLSTGKVSFAATGSASQSGVFTGSVAASTFSVTGQVTGNVLTVTAVGSGTIVNGATISGTGIATGTKIVGQLTGTTGGVGTYAVSIGEQASASVTVSGTYGTMTVTVAAAAPIVVGGVLTGTGVTAGTQVTAFITGTGGTGTYVVDKNTVVSSTADLNETLNVETKWVAASSGLAGELVKMTSWLNG